MFEKHNIAINKVKIIELDIESNRTKPHGCPECGKSNYIGFTSSYGAFKRCLECRYEWAMGGIPSLAVLNSEEKEFLTEFQTSQMQDDALTQAMAQVEDADRISEVRESEKQSGHVSNREFWARWEEEQNEQG